MWLPHYLFETALTPLTLMGPDIFIMSLSDTRGPMAEGSGPPMRGKPLGAQGIQWEGSLGAPIWLVVINWGSFLIAIQSRINAIMDQVGISFGAIWYQPTIILGVKLVPFL